MTCEKTMPQSYAVMLQVSDTHCTMIVLYSKSKIHFQLPPPQLSQFLEDAPHLREPLLLHVQNFNETQRAHVSGKIFFHLRYFFKFHSCPSIHPAAVIPSVRPKNCLTSFV